MLHSRGSLYPRVRSEEVEDPTNLGIADNVFPRPIRSTAVCIIKDKAYAFCGQDTVSSTSLYNNIYSASVSDLTSWSDTGVTFPSSIDEIHLAIVGEKIFFIGGQDSSGAGVNTIYSASVHSPLVISNTGKTLPTGMKSTIAYVHNGTIFLPGGRDAGFTDSNDMQLITVGDPPNTRILNSAFGQTTRSRHGIHINDSFYFVGGTLGGSAADDILRIPLNDPNGSWFLPGTFLEDANISNIWTAGDRVYMTSGIDRTIYQTRLFLTASSLTPVVSGAYDAVPGITRDGEHVIMTSWQRYGMAPWKTYGILNLTSSSFGDTLTVGSTTEFTSSVGIAELWHPDAHTDSNNDEFESSTLDAAWEAYEGNASAAASISEGTVNAYDTGFTGTGTLRVTVNPDERKSWMLMQAPSNATGTAPNWGYYFTKVVTIPTNCIIWTRLKFPIKSPAVADEGNIALVVGASTAGHFDQANHAVLYLNEPDAGPIIQAQAIVYNSGSPTGVGTTDDTNQTMSALEYAAIHKIGTTYHFWVGNSQGNWIHLGSTTFSASVDRIGFLAVNKSATAPGVDVVGVDFIRMLETSNFLL